MEKTKKYILDKVAKSEIDLNLAKQLLKELSENKEAVPTDIAIVGMAGRFPKSEDIRQYWDTLCNGINCIDEWPSSRTKDFLHILKNDHYAEFILGGTLDRDQLTTEDLYEKGGYLSDVMSFDADFFNIPPREARYMDIIQRMALQTAWQTFEDAGYGGDRIRNTRTGVFLGKENTNVPLFRFAFEKDPMQLTGSWESIAVSRINYLFNLTGPCMIIDTACSSGMVSIHKAAQAILHGECDMALAGGINALLTGDLKGEVKGIMDLGSVESKSKQVRTFDRNANGTVWGEGVGMVLLKSLKQAIEDGDHIYAVVKGSSINNDGASNGITAPSAEAQEDLLLRVWKNAQIDPEQIGYYEAHGTGTVLGDPIEIKGLTKAFKKFTSKKQFCAIGSLKTNMGHLVAASGAAAVIKVALSLYHRKLPPSINFQEPNPYINFPDSPVYINDRLKDWSSENLRYAATSSFGFSGTNCHMLLERFESANRFSSRTQEQYFFTLSAKKKHLLEAYVRKYQGFLSEMANMELADVCYTLNTGRGHYACRLIIAARTMQELIGKLESIDPENLSTDEAEGVFYGEHKIIHDNRIKSADIETRESELQQKNEWANKLLRDPNRQSVAANLTALCKEYLSGASPDWTYYFSGEKRYKISLPSYPFEMAYLVGEPRQSQQIGGSSGRPLVHPVLGELVATTSDTYIFEQRLQVSKQWTLGDHRIGDMPVLPGTAYLDVARAAFSHVFGSDAMEFSNVLFFNTLSVSADAVSVIQTILKKQDNQYYFEIFSRKAGVIEANSWLKHVEGYVGPTEVSTEFVAIHELSQHLGTPEEGFSLEKDDNEVFQFGPRWRNVKKLWTSSERSMALVELDKSFAGDLKQYKLHPAMLDNALNIVSQGKAATYLPFSFRKFSQFKALPEKFYSVLRCKTDRSSAPETVSYDVQLVDYDGCVLAEAKDYIIKKADGSKLHKNREEYTGLKWEKRTDEKEAKILSPDDIVLFISASKNDAALLERVGQDCRVIVLKKEAWKETYQQVLSQLDMNRLVYIIETFQPSPLDADQPLLGIDQSLLTDLFERTKILVNAKIKPKNGLHFITRKAYYVDDAEEEVDPMATAIGGLCQVIQQEFDHLKVGLLDTDAGSTPDSIWREIRTERDNKAFTYMRDNCLYRMTLATIAQDELKTEPQVQFANAGCVVITGGAGGLGLAVARHVCRQGGIRLILIGRTPFPERSSWEELVSLSTPHKLSSKIEALLELESWGNTVDYYAGDVADEGAMKTVFADIKQKYDHINGIIHAAGNAGKGFMLTKSAQLFESVIRPKVVGSVLLHQLTKDEELKFFILFSSTTSLLGGEGQGDYAAANAFLNGFSQFLQHKGVPVHAIMWPAWKDTGMAVDYQVDEDQLAFKPLATKEALSAFDRIINDSLNLIIPSSPNYKYLLTDPDAIRIGLSAEIHAEISRRKREKNGVSDKKEPFIIKEVALKGKSKLTETERQLGLIFGNVLGLEELDVLDSFQEMGGDSILATYLLKEILKSFPDTVDISDVFSYPTVCAMAEYIDSLRGALTEQIASPEKGDLDQVIQRMEEGSSIDEIMKSFK